MPSRALIAIVVILLLVLGAGIVVTRTMGREAREIAARLTGCPASEITADKTDDTDPESWRIDGCGIRGVLVCEPAGVGCFIVPDGP